MEKILFIATLILALTVPAWAADWSDIGGGTFIDMESVKRTPEGNWHIWAKYLNTENKDECFVQEMGIYPGKDIIWFGCWVLYDKNGKALQSGVASTYKPEWVKVIPGSRVELIQRFFEATEKRMREKATETQQ